MTILRIVGLHGVSNFQPGLSPKEAERRIAGWWSAALGERVANSTEIALCYYAHLLKPHVSQGVGRLDADESTAADIHAWARSLGYPEGISQGRLMSPARAAVEWVADRFGLNHRIAEKFVSAFFGEVHNYFMDPACRAAVIAHTSKLLDRHQPDVVVAHSLGSVVAYEALWNAAATDVKLFLTLGSPLAMPDVVFDRLSPHPGPRARPPRVGRWINVADPGDIIAVPRGGVSGKFAHVTADIVDVIHLFDFHRAENYLRCGATTGALAAFL